MLVTKDTQCLQKGKNNRIRSKNSDSTVPRRDTRGLPVRRDGKLLEVGEGPTGRGTRVVSFRPSQDSTRRGKWESQVRGSRPGESVTLYGLV